MAETRKPNRKNRLELARLELEVRQAEIDLVSAQRRESRELAYASEHCIYNFSGEVSMSSAQTAIDNLGRMARVSPGCALTVVFCSPGGNVLAGFALYDFLRGLSDRGHHVTTVGLGAVLSMGGVLLQAGDTRRMTPNAYLMIHEVSARTGGKIGEIDDDQAFFKSSWERSSKLLAERSNLSEKEVRKRAERRDWWLNSDEALSLGFIDEIGH